MSPSFPDPRIRALYQTLSDYLEAVPRQQELNAPDLMALFRQLDEHEKEVVGCASPELRHYLHQKSYRKAYLYLQDKNPGTA